MHALRSTSGRTACPGCSQSQPKRSALMSAGKPAVATSSTVPKDMQIPRGIPTVTKLTWEKPLKVIKYPDPRLRAANARVGVFDNSLQALAQQMIAVMYEDDGVGLAAPQVGVNIRMMVFNPFGSDKPGNETILVNPEIISVSGPRMSADEGCLSFPGTYAPVERNRDLEVRAQNEKGESITLKLGGEDEQAAWRSRIFQHEYDHLQGILFHDRMLPAALETVRAEIVELETAFATAHPGRKYKRLEPLKVTKGF